MIATSLLLAVGLGVGAPALAPAPALAYLAQVMDRFHLRFDVYSDADAAGNHFHARGRMSSPGDEAAVPPMDEAFTGGECQGLTSIRAVFHSRGRNWGGWYFLNGVLHAGEIVPRPNWGSQPDAGVDLSGATRLTFLARGERGGEQVEFFCLGVGRDVATGVPTAPYPDSDRKASTGWVRLTRTWREYSIDLRGRDLRYVLGGFGWVTNALANRNRDVVFYLDEIRYDKPRPEEPRFLLSYQTAASYLDRDAALRNVAFVYDNAVALRAFLARGQRRRAKLVADALAAAIERDRYFGDGRVRNAYQAGDLLTPPGWLPQAKGGVIRLPGRYDPASRRWLEDEYQVSTHTGNVAWAMLALLSYTEATGERRYLAAAERMGRWVERHCRDQRGAGGYTGGFQGWEPAPRKLQYKATEHNLDLYAAFRRLYRLTRDPQWLERAAHAKRFVLAMWDAAGGKFWTGTLEDGETVNRAVIPLDIQAWAVLALGEEGHRYAGSLAYAEKHHRVGGGFDFNEDRDGVWCEGTAQMAVAYRHTGQLAKWRAAVEFLRAAQHASGGLPAADRDGLTTGFGFSYYRRLHVGATAWLALAELGVNPFAPQPGLIP